MCVEPDSGVAADAGEDVDAGDGDAGTGQDATAMDTGFDAGAEDSGRPDSGVGPDMGVPDTGATDIGTPDAGAADTGTPDSGVPDTGTPDTGVGDTGTVQDAGTPSCVLDSQCASGRCHPLYQQCVPAAQKLSCESCASDAECGLPLDACLDVFSGQTYLETVCAQACNANGDCPIGYACTLNNHCYPVAGSIRIHTCAALDDMLAQKACDASNGIDECGLPNFDDGTCVPFFGCSVGCGPGVDCPSGSTCTNVVVADYCLPP